MARRHMRGERAGHTLQATALVNEAFLKLADEPEIDWKDRAHFFAIASQWMRRILVDHGRARQAQRRGGAQVTVVLSEANAAIPEPAVDVLALHELLNRLQELDEVQARIVEMRYFGGLTMEEIAAVLGVSSRTVTREWDMARSWLRLHLKDGNLGPFGVKE